MRSMPGNTGQHPLAESAQRGQIAHPRGLHARPVVRGLWSASLRQTGSRVANPQVLIG